MKTLVPKFMVLGALFAFTGNPASHAETESSKAATPSLGSAKEKAVRLQVFLDRAEFAPGKIDGQTGEFTRKALELYREAIAGTETKTSGTDDYSDLDLASVEPLFITYTITEADADGLGEVPEGVEEQEKGSSMPYESVLEVIAEKFHAEAGFLSTLNPDKSGEFKVGDQVTVPNVVPFEIAAVPALKSGSIAGLAQPSATLTAVSGEEPVDKDKATGDKAVDKDKTTAKTPAAATGDKAADKENAPKETRAVATAEEKAAQLKELDAAEIAVFIDTESNMLTVREHGKPVAAYPVTLGSALNESPIGDWQITGIAKMPTFRHDEKMLQGGVRGDEFHMIPPGPNNPVGVVWIALNKDGIGIHGTGDPDSIGRSSSHGCLRMANWDVARLAQRVSVGVPVLIH